MFLYPNQQCYTSPLFSHPLSFLSLHITFSSVEKLLNLKLFHTAVIFSPSQQSYIPLLYSNPLSSFSPPKPFSISPLSTNYWNLFSSLCSYPFSIPTFPHPFTLPLSFVLKPLIFSSLQRFFTSSLTSLFHLLLLHTIFSPILLFFSLHPKCKLSPTPSPLLIFLSPHWIYHPNPFHKPLNNLFISLSFFFYRTNVSILLHLSLKPLIISFLLPNDSTPLLFFLTLFNFLFTLKIFPPHLCPQTSQPIFYFTTPLSSSPPPTYSSSSAFLYHCLLYIISYKTPVPSHNFRCPSPL